eukprot:g10948.t1
MNRNFANELCSRQIRRPFLFIWQHKHFYPRGRHFFSSSKITNPNIKNELRPGVTQNGSRLAQLLGGEEAIKPWSLSRRLIVSASIALTLTFTAYVSWGAETISEYLMSFFVHNPELIIRFHAQKCISRHPEVENALGFPLGFDRSGYRCKRVKCEDDAKRERVRMRFKAYGPRGEAFVYVQGDVEKEECEFVSVLLPSDESPHPIFDSLSRGRGCLPKLCDEE